MLIKQYGDQPISSQLIGIMNFRGTGIPLTESIRNGGIDDDLVFTSLRALTVAQGTEFGIQFTNDVTVFDPRPLGFAQDFLTGMRDEIRDGVFSEVSWERLIHGLEHAVPLILPPFDRNTYVDLTHVGEYYLHMRNNPDLLGTLPVTRRADLVRPDPLPYYNKTALGPVSRGHIREFMVGFPESYRALIHRLERWFGIDWSAANPYEMSAYVSELLNIRVDVRIGSLVTREELQHALSAAHQPTADVLGIPRIDGDSVPFGNRRLDGACWSVAADRIIGGTGAELQDHQDGVCGVLDCDEWDYRERTVN